MDIESKIMLGFLFAFIAGIFIGWYVTWQAYRLEEEKRQANADYWKKKRKKAKRPPTMSRERIAEKLGERFKIT